MAPIAWEEIFQSHERFLWGLLYRLTGNAADAEELVQETFVRAMKSPPPNTDEPWRPWLVRVAVNLGRDCLRRRRTQGYDGVWLPSPIETEPEVMNDTPTYEPADEYGDPAARYDQLESVSFAFLLALEALTPAQRAVLLLRDVFDYSVRETATALAMSEANVKTTHSRVRRAMRGYDEHRTIPSPAFHERARQSLERFLHCLSQHDVAGVEALLARDVVALSDGGGEFFAARLPVKGVAKVAQFYLNLTKYVDAATIRIQLLWLNGTAAILFDLGPRPAGYAPRSVILLDVRPTGEIGRVYTVLATRKLAALKNPASET